MTSPTNSNPFGNSTFYFPGIDNPFEFEALPNINPESEEPNTNINSRESTASTSSESGSTNPSPTPPTPESKEAYTATRSYCNLQTHPTSNSRLRGDLSRVPCTSVPVTNMTDEEKKEALKKLKVRNKDLDPKARFRCKVCQKVFKQYNNARAHFFCRKRDGGGSAGMNNNRTVNQH